MTYNVEIEIDKNDYDAGRGNRYPILKWLVNNCGHSLGEDRTWDCDIDYERSAPQKLLEVYKFKNSRDAVMFKLKWG